MKKRYWILIAICIALLPLGLNWLILQPKWFEVVGNGDVWLSFWATYISAVISLVMVITTFLTLKQMRHQWEEERRPELIFSLQFLPKIPYPCLKISNIGMTKAVDVRIEISGGFFETLKKKHIGEFAAIDINKNLKEPLEVFRGESLFIYIESNLSTHNFYEYGVNDVVVRGLYNGKYEVDNRFIPIHKIENDNDAK